MLDRRNPAGKSLGSNCWQCATAFDQSWSLQRFAFASDSPVRSPAIAAVASPAFEEAKRLASTPGEALFERKRGEFFGAARHSAPPVEGASVSRLRTRSFAGPTHMKCVWRCGTTWRAASGVRV